jgi:hypothetical protein
MFELMLDKEQTSCDDLLDADFEYHISGAYATAFFICPDCHNKFFVKIQDLGKVR